jgi:LytR cell envelope-related transcriptional attenuator
VTVPGRGDLSPPHRQSPIGRWLVTAVVLALLVGGGYAVFLGLTGSSSPSSSAANSGGQLSACRNVTTTGPAKPSSVQLVVLNGTVRVGLAAQVAATLRRRGFHISSVGNTVRLTTGVATIRYPAGKLREAQAVSDQIAGATLTRGHGKQVELAIGSQFKALLSPAKAAAARHHLVVVGVTRPGSTPTPTPRATCSAPS